MASSNDFSNLERLFSRRQRATSPGSILREQLRQNRRLRALSRQGAFEKSIISSASLLASIVGDGLLGNQQNLGDFFSNGSMRDHIGINGGASGHSANTASGAGDIFSGNAGQFAVASLFINLFEGLASDLLSRTKHTTTTRESQRSQEFSNRWSTSRSQQNAQLASIVQRGLGEL